MPTEGRVKLIVLLRLRRAIYLRCRGEQWLTQVAKGSINQIV